MTFYVYSYIRTPKVYMLMIAYETHPTISGRNALETRELDLAENPKFFPVTRKQNFGVFFLF